MFYYCITIAGKSHWVCVSSDGSAYIEVFDSLAGNGLNVGTVLQLSKLYSLPANHSFLNIKCQSVQQQRGAFDCGLYAIAYAAERCSGRNPEEASFSQEKMRSHLHVCLSKGAIHAFPKALRSHESVSRPKCSVVKVKVYCKCKMPAQYDTDMIQCGDCGHWYHCSCVNVDPSNVPEYWECYQCC